MMHQAATLAAVAQPVARPARAGAAAALQDCGPWTGC